MSIEKIYALLDADFIIKTMIAQKDTTHSLLDWIVSDSHYQLVCHEMAVREISKHDMCGAVPWIKKAIADGKVKQYTDQLILTELCEFMGSSGIQMYKSFLRASCDSMSTDFYAKYYTPIDKFDILHGVEAFLDELYRCDIGVGSSQSLGERKAMIMLQWLQYFHPDKVYLFCSDDRKARASLYSITSVPCKAVMTVFWDMKKQGIDKTESYQYFYPLEQFLTRGGKTAGNIRVLASDTNNHISVPCKQVFDEIFEDKYDSLKTGFLKYKQCYLKMKDN